MINALTIAQLQTIAAYMRTLKAGGVVTVEQAEEAIDSHLHFRLSERQQLATPPHRKEARRAVVICPDCGKEMKFCPTSGINYCRCGYSKPVA